MLLSFNKSRHASHSQSGLALLTLLFSLFLTFILTAWINEKRRQSPVAENPYPPFLGQSYPEDAKPTARQRQWALATSAVLTEVNNCCHFILEETQTQNGHGAKTLRNGWGVHNRGDLLRTLKWLEEGGHRKHCDDYVKMLRKSGQLAPPSEMRYAADLYALDDREERTLAVAKIIHKRFGKQGLTGWDFSRYVSLCRWGVHAKYLTEEEAWIKIMPVARMLQSTFRSWVELGYNYRLGRTFWSPMCDESYILDALDKLKNENTSPWAALPWHVNLLPEKQQDDGSEEFLHGRALIAAFGNDCDKKTWKAYCSEAFTLFGKSAEKGNISGMYFLANCYNHGQGCPPDQQLYRQWIEKCVAADEPWSHYRWALNCYWNKGLNVDENRIAELIAFSATNNGSAASVAMLGWIYETGYGETKIDLKKALDHYYQAASTEEAWAMSQIGDLYQKGLGVEKNNCEAARWYRRAAISGEKQGMFKYAECLRKGEGIPTNTVEALTWYHRAATNNETRAINYLKRLEEK
jgi:TPR repeat protein